MAWPQTAIVTDEPVTTVGLNSLPVMIANTTLGSDAANIDFQSIPSHYGHLRLVLYVRSTEAAAGTTLLVRFNGDTGSNYDSQKLTGSAATAAAVETFGGTAALGPKIPGSTAGANLFAGVIIDIPDYANTVNNKSCSLRSSHKSGTATTNLEVWRQAGFWRSNNAITQVTIVNSAGSNLASGSRATLYGLP